MRNHDGEPMKVVVYFRQDGGVAAKDYALNTHWTEDQNEDRIPLFSAFDLSYKQILPAEIIEQIEATNPWLEAQRGFVIATYTEIEDRSSRRPAYGAARKAAAHQRAVLAVATGRPVGPSKEFYPSSQDGVAVVVLIGSEREHLAREQWTVTGRAVVYFRVPLAGAEAGDLLAKQRAAVQKMSGSITVLAEFTENEGPGQNERPQLDRALNLCREQTAFLLIGTTDAIESGAQFQPDFTDVPYEVAYRKDYDWPDVIPITACPHSVALLFGRQWVRGNVPLYLANASGTDFVDVEVMSRGSTLSGGDILETNVASKNLGAIASGQGHLLEAYDVYFDGDFLTEYQVRAQRANGTTFKGRAVVKDIPVNRWIEVRDQNLTRF